MHEVVPGPTNLITDVAGIRIGNAEDDSVRTGVTVLLADAPAVAAADIRGGGPGTREIAALDPSCLVAGIDALVLAGGSVFGLEAAAGVTTALAARGVGFTFGSQPLPCPIVPAAILFDLANGGDKAWGDDPPYRDLGKAACETAADRFALGNAGAGFGALAGNLKGGLGSASAVVDGVTVGALVAVNSFGACVDPRTGNLWAAAFERDDEFGGRRSPPAAGPASLTAGTKLEASPGAAQPGANTTIAVVATDARLTKGQAQRLAIMATDGMARAIRPVHTSFDGDTVFALSTGQRALADPAPIAVSAIGAVAADTLARAIGRALYHAVSIGGHICWREAIDM